MVRWSARNRTAVRCAACVRNDRGRTARGARVTAVHVVFIGAPIGVRCQCEHAHHADACQNRAQYRATIHAHGMRETFDLCESCALQYVSEEYAS